MHNGPLTRVQQRWAAYLSAGGLAAMCGRTAMEMWGVTGHDDGAIHVLVRRGARVLPVAGVAIVVHESRRFPLAGVVFGRGPQLTSPAPAALDAAARARPPPRPPPPP